MDKQQLRLLHVMQSQASQAAMVYWELRILVYMMKYSNITQQLVFDIAAQRAQSLSQHKCQR